MNKEFMEWSDMIIANRKEAWEKHQNGELAKVWAEFKETSDFIIQNRKQRRERLSKE